MRKTVMSALLAAMILSGCGGESSEKMLASARNYMAKSDNKAAVIQLKNALQGDPNLAEARFLLGKAMLDSGDPTSADVELRKASELKYPAEQVVPLQARALLMLGQPRKVIDDLAKTPLSSPQGTAELQTSVGQAYLLTN
ncbi:MAG: tetratricopeptide repeat protein, partial [Propionivibrio sp.]